MKIIHYLILLLGIYSIKLFAMKHDFSCKVNSSDIKKSVVTCLRHNQLDFVDLTLATMRSHISAQDYNEFIAASLVDKANKEEITKALGILQKHQITTASLTDQQICKLLLGSAVAAATNSGELFRYSAVINNYTNNESRIDRKRNVIEFVHKEFHKLQNIAENKSKLQHAQSILDILNKAK